MCIVLIFCHNGLKITIFLSVKKKICKRMWGQTETGNMQQKYLNRFKAGTLQLHCVHLKPVKAYYVIQFSLLLLNSWGGPSWMQLKKNDLFCVVFSGRQCLTLVLEVSGATLTIYLIQKTIRCWDVGHDNIISC